MLVRTRGYGDSSKPSWLLIKHKDEWSGPIDITEFAPLSVKTPDADFADILAADTPDVWHSNPPAKGGDTGKLFQRIIATALELREQHARRCAGPADVGGEGRRAAGRHSARRPADARRKTARDSREDRRPQAAPSGKHRQAQPTKKKTGASR